MFPMLSIYSFNVHEQHFLVYEIKTLWLSGKTGRKSTPENKVSEQYFYAPSPPFFFFFGPLYGNPCEPY